jgi:hypothetical protein
VDLAVGQVGFFDGNTYTATTAPTYATNKAIYIGQGMPDVSHLPLMAGIPQTNQLSKLIKGKLLKKIRRKSASRGQNQVVAIGFDGIDTTKTLSARCGEVRTVYVKATGNPIDKLYSKHGFIRQYRIDTGCCDECGGDSCADVDPSALADILVEKINTDPKWNAGGGQLFRARKVLSSALDTTGTTVYNIYNLVIADNGDEASLATVQVQYPGFTVKRISRDGIISTYELIATSLPAAFTNAGLFTIANCETCPTGYTLNANQYIYLVRKMDAGDAAALATVTSQYGIVSPETIARIAYTFGQSTYIIRTSAAVSPTAAANEVQSVIATGATAGNFTLTFDGETTANIAYNANAAAVQSALEALSNINPGDVTVAGGALPGTAVTITFGGQYANTNVPQMTADSSGLTGGTAVVSTTTAGAASAGTYQLLADNQTSTCVLTTPTTTAWSDVGDLYAFPKEYTITLQDNVCGESRLTELQAYYPDLTIVQEADGPVDCIHQYSTTILSEPTSIDCAVDQLVFPPIPAFGNAQWKEVATTPSGTVQAGVLIETAFVNRITGDCTYEYFPYEADTIHIEVSEYNADYNASPCENRWPVSEIQSVKYPQGVGARVRDEEKKSLSYFLQERSMDPAVREAEGYVLQTNPQAYYDEFTIEYDFKYKVGGWSETYTDSYHQVIYVPEGSGTQLQQALITYAESVGNDVEIELN